MDRLTVPVSEESPLLEVEVSGDLTIKGSDEMEISVKTGLPEQTRLEQSGDRVRLFCPDDCKVLAPRDTRLHIISLGGDGVIKAIEGEIEIESALGDLTLRSVGSTTVKEVNGRLEGKNILGDMRVQKVSGNLVVRDIQGDFFGETIHGNLVLDDVDGDVEANCHGNATLRLDPTPAASYKVKAGGNLTCSLPEDASVELEVRCKGNLLISFPELQVNETRREPYTAILGDGDAKAEFEAAGNVMINSQPSEWQMPEIQFGEEIGAAAESFAEQIARQIEAQMQMLDHQLNAQLAHLQTSLGAAGYSQEQIQRIQERARQASERAAAMAQEKLQRVQERLERKLAQAQRHAERQARAAEARARAAEQAAHRSHRAHYPWSKSVEPTQEPVKEEERLLILKMLQEKKITLEEAELLLSALEGK